MQTSLFIIQVNGQVTQMYLFESLTWDDQKVRLENSYKTKLSEMGWGERVIGVAVESKNYWLDKLKVKLVSLNKAELNEMVWAECEIMVIE